MAASRRPVDDKRFEHEYWALTRVRHPRIVAPFFAGDVDGERFYSMELLQGEGLDAVVHRGALAAGRVVAIGIQLCEALEAFHERGVIHRDLKPANVLLLAGEGADQVKLLDPGIAKLLPKFYEGTEMRTPPEERLRTQAGARMGTPGYIAPEVGLGAEAAPAQDIFGLGVTLFRLATGRMPYAELQPIEAGDEPRWSAELGVPLPAALEGVLRRAVAANPELRQRSMRDLREQLVDAAEEMAAESEVVGAGLSVEVERDAMEGMKSRAGRGVIEARSAGTASAGRGGFVPVSLGSAVESVVGGPSQAARSTGGPMSTTGLRRWVITSLVLAGVFAGVAITYVLDRYPGSGDTAVAGPIRWAGGIEAAARRLEAKEHDGPVEVPLVEKPAVEFLVDSPPAAPSPGDPAGSEVVEVSRSSQPDSDQAERRPSAPPPATRDTALRRWARTHDDAIQRCLTSMSSGASIKISIEVSPTGDVVGLQGPPSMPGLIGTCLRSVFAGFRVGALPKSTRTTLTLSRRSGGASG